MNTATRAWSAIYICGCTDSQEVKADLPDACPGHGKRQQDRPELHRPILPEGKIQLGHVCYNQPCPEVP